MAKLPSKVKVTLLKGKTFKLFTADEWYSFEKGGDSVEVPLTPSVVGYIKDQRFQVIVEKKAKKTTPVVEVEKTETPEKSKE
jgi:hypothetical protein